MRIAKGGGVCPPYPLDLYTRIIRRLTVSAYASSAPTPAAGPSPPSFPTYILPEPSPSPSQHLRRPPPPPPPPHPDHHLPPLSVPNPAPSLGSLPAASWLRQASPTDKPRRPPTSACGQTRSQRHPCRRNAWPHRPPFSISRRFSAQAQLRRTTTAGLAAAMPTPAAHFPAPINRVSASIASRTRAASKEEDVQVLADICRDNRNVARELKKPKMWMQRPRSVDVVLAGRGF
jgi:hypothetical protein